MKVKGLNNRTYLWRMPGKNRKKISSYHERARRLISNLYWNFYEEVFLPGCINRLYLDFYIPTVKMAVEVQGEQHFAYNPFFHSSELSYTKSTGRDDLKKLWCEKNNITLVELIWDQTDEQWTKELRGKT